MLRNVLPRGVFLLFVLMMALSLVLAACGADDEVVTDDDLDEDVVTDEVDEDEPEPPADQEEPADEPEELTTIVYPMLAGGAGLIPAHYISETGLDEEHGLKFELRHYDDLSTYYSDGAQGILDVVHGSVDAFAAQASTGVPIHLIATMTPWHGWVVGPDDFAFEDPTDLVGARLSTIAASGTFQTMRGALQDWYDFDLEAETEIIGAGNPAAAMTQVSAGTADVGVSWEPSVTAAMLEDEQLEVIYDLGADFEDRYGLQMWHFVMVMQNESDLPEGTADAFVATFQAAAEFLMDNPEEADQYAQEVDFEPGVVQEAIEAGRLVYDIRPIDDDIRTSVEQGLEFLPEDHFDGEIPESFFGAAATD